MAHLTVAHAVDRTVSPRRRGGRERLRVGVARRRVVGQQHETLAVAAVHLDFAEVEVGAVAAPAPFHVHLVARNHGGDRRLDGRQVGAGLLRTLDAEREADGLVVTGVGLDELHEGAETRLNARRDRPHRRGQHGRDRRAAGGRIAAATDEGFPTPPLLRGVADERHALEGVIQVRRVGRLRGDLLGGHADGGGIVADAIFESLKLRVERIIVLENVVGLGHDSGVLRIEGEKRGAGPVKPGKWAVLGGFGVFFVKNRTAGPFIGVAGRIIGAAGGSSRTDNWFIGVAGPFTGVAGCSSRTAERASRTDKRPSHTVGRASRVDKWSSRTGKCASRAVGRADRAGLVAERVRTSCGHKPENATVSGLPE